MQRSIITTVQYYVLYITVQVCTGTTTVQYSTVDVLYGTVRYQVQYTTVPGTVQYTIASRWNTTVLYCIQ